MFDYSNISQIKQNCRASYHLSLTHNYCGAVVGGLEEAGIGGSLPHVKLAVGKQLALSLAGIRTGDSGQGAPNVVANYFCVHLLTRPAYLKG